MIDQSMLDSVKLVSADNLATIAIVEREVQRVVSQGSQGWGVRREDAVILRLVSELRQAQLDAQASTDTHNKLKGLQLENGRLKKRLTVADGIEVAHNIAKGRVDGLLKEVTELTTRVENETQRREEAERALEGHAK